MSPAYEGSISSNDFMSIELGTIKKWITSFGSNAFSWEWNADSNTTLPWFAKDDQQ